MQHGNYTEALTYVTRFSYDNNNDFILESARICMNNEPYYSLTNDEALDKIYYNNDFIDTDWNDTMGDNNIFIRPI